MDDLNTTMSDSNTTIIPESFSNNGDDHIEDDDSGDSLNDYSPFQIVMWFVMFGLGMLVAYFVRTSVIRYMERRIQDRIPAARASRRIQRQRMEEAMLALETATRQAFLDKTLTSYTWGAKNEEDDDGSKDSEMIATKDGSGEGMDNDLQATSISQNQEDSANGVPAAQKQECSICLANFCPGDQVTKSNNVDCPHVFHRTCVYQWLLQHGECPMCRKEFLLPSQQSSAHNTTRLQVVASRRRRQ
jgi:hypothetical protein